jgi:hypothetical protein
MTPRLKKTRLEHFLEPYQPLPEGIEAQIWDRVHRAGWAPDDPVSLQIAFDLIQQARMEDHLKTLDAAPQKIRNAIADGAFKVQQSHHAHRSAEWTDIGNRVEGEVRKALHQGMAGLQREFQWRIAQRIVGGLVLLILLTGGTGYIVGRHDTERLAESYAALSVEPDARTWMDLQRVNPNIDVTMAKFCRPGAARRIDSPNGQAACEIPLWIQPPAPRPSTAMEKLQAYIGSLQARLPFPAVLVLGILIGLCLAPLARRARQWALKGT